MNPSEAITEYIDKLGDWRGRMLERLRKVILDAAPELVEEWKWNTPIWSHNGNVMAAGAFRDHVKLNFFKGRSLEDPDGLFNAGLDAKATRAIDISAGDIVNESALKKLIRAAVALNSTAPGASAGQRPKGGSKVKTGPKVKSGPKATRKAKNG